MRISHPTGLQPRCRCYSGPLMTEQLRWQPLFTLRLDLDYGAVQNIGTVSTGARINVPVLGGTFEGPRLRGRVLPGADWVLFRPDGAMLIDVRLALQTDDGATIAMSYVGLAYGHVPDAMARFRRREVVADADISVHTTPRFETGDARYDWLNRVTAVSNGNRDESGPYYHVFEIL